MCIEIKMMQKFYRIMTIIMDSSSLPLILTICWVKSPNFSFVKYYKVLCFSVEVLEKIAIRSFFALINCWSFLPWMEATEKSVWLEAVGGPLSPQGRRACCSTWNIIYPSMQEGKNLWSYFFNAMYIVSCLLKMMRFLHDGLLRTTWS